MDRTDDGRLWNACRTASKIECTVVKYEVTDNEGKIKSHGLGLLPYPEKNTEKLREKLRGVAKVSNDSYQMKYEILDESGSAIEPDLETIQVAVPKKDKSPLVKLPGALEQVELSVNEDKDATAVEDQVILEFQDTIALRKMEQKAKNEIRRCLSRHSQKSKDKGKTGSGTEKTGPASNEELK